MIENVSKKSCESENPKNPGSDLPPNWSWIKLGDVSKKIHYGYTASAENKNVGPKLLRITDIQGGKVDWAEVPYCTIPSDDIQKYLLSENDIVFARTGATVGKSFLIKGKIPSSVFASYLIRLQLSDKTLPKFIYHFFQSNHYWSQIKSSSAGIGQPNVNAQKLSNLDIPLPPLPEQKKIVEKIEELFSGLDSGVSSLKKAKAQIRLYRQSVLSAAFLGKLTQETRSEKQAYLNGVQVASNKKSDRLNAIQEFNRAAEPKIEYSTQLPDGWKWVKVSDVGDIITGTTPSKKVAEYYGNDFPLYKPTDLNAGINTRNSSDNISKLGATKARLLPEKSTMVTCIGATIGKTGMNKIPGTTNQQINSIIPNKNYIPEYVYYFCISKFFQDQIKTKASSTTLPILNKSKFELLPFIQIPLAQQAQIVEEIEKRFSEADNLEKAIDDSLAKSETLRQSILKQAFEGKLV